MQEAGLRELRNWHRFIHDPFIAPDAARLDRTWQWTRYLMGSYVLNDAYGRIGEILNGLEQEIRRRNKIRVKDSDELAGRAPQSVGQCTGFVPLPVCPVVIFDRETQRAIPFA